MKALFVVLGNYLWRNRHELRERMDRSGMAEKLSEGRLLRRLRGFRPVAEPDRDEPIEVKFRKLG